MNSDRLFEKFCKDLNKKTSIKKGYESICFNHFITGFLK